MAGWSLALPRVRRRRRRPLRPYELYAIAMFLIGCGGVVSSVLTGDMPFAAIDGGLAVLWWRRPIIIRLWGPFGWAIGGAGRALRVLIFGEDE